MRSYKNLENFYCCRSDKVSMVLAIVAEFRAKDQVERILLESTTDTILNTIMSNRESGCGVKANRKAAVWFCIRGKESFHKELMEKPE